MELVAKVSKGSKMDQIYIPKNRSGFSVGSYVVLKPLDIKKVAKKQYFYNIKYIEPIKLDIIREIFGIIDKISNNYENIIITGSFLDDGFNFKDIDILLITENKLSIGVFKNTIEDKIGIKAHIILLDNKILLRGLSTDPLYMMMLSRCISKKRFSYNITTKIDYKILDLHLLKSKNLIKNFDLLNGDEKYYLVRNMVAIYLFLQNKKIDNDRVDKAILRIFNLNGVNEIKQNMLNKSIFLNKYKIIYGKSFNKIMESINGPK